jgi:HJR/Mrr/RecB family endonuclease
MSMINHRAGREGKGPKDRTMTQAEVRDIQGEIYLMLDEMAKMVEEELIAIRLMQKYDPQDPQKVFETTVQYLERKSYRSVNQDAVLAYARKQLRRFKARRED